MNGLPGYPFSVIAHPIANNDDDALRAKAQNALGQAFDVCEFHSQVLLDGALPMDVLSAKIDRWIATKKR